MPDLKKTKQNISVNMALLGLTGTFLANLNVYCDAYFAHHENILKVYVSEMILLPPANLKTVSVISQIKAR